MRLPGPRLIFGLGAPLLIVVLLLAAWAIDSSTSQGKVPRNATLAGRAVGNLPEDQLAATVADVAEYYQSIPVRVRTPGTTYEVEAGLLGLRLDQKATIRNALRLQTDRPLWRQPLVWLASVVSDREVPLEFTLDSATLESGIAALGGDRDPVEPNLVASSGRITAVSGKNGRRISPDGLGEQLLASARSGETPLVVNADVVEASPVITDEMAEGMATLLTAATDDGLRVTAEPHEAHLPPEVVRSWLGSRVNGEELEITLDPERAISDLTDALPDPTDPTDATITLVDGAATVIPGTDGFRCCGTDTSARLLAGIQTGSGAVAIDLQVVQPSFTTADAEALGVREPVGTTVEWKGQPQVKSFTTYFECCQNRVHNIHLIADDVRGTLVKPGETFSINQVVGRRTAEKGYLPAGAIANGVIVDEVGGGVSQFATTMFNAAFFAGLPFGEYQAHSQHFNRYPYGREATMGYEHPDLQWINNTPYGILVWTSYTDTSVTVTLYSTQHAGGEQTGQTTGRSGRCTTVATERTIHRADGSTSTDTVRARYRDQGATSC